MRRLLVLALPAAFCILLAGCAAVDEPGSTAAPTTASSRSPQATGTDLPSNQPDDIAYVRSDHIWRARSDGSEPVQLTSDSGADFAPAWSPDHTHIAFVHRDDPDSMTTSTLCVVPAAGGQVSRWEFNRSIAALCYSPDGDRIALAELLLSGDSPAKRISVLDTASGETTVVRRLRDPWTTGLAVSWSPDGDRLLVGLSKQDAEDQQTGVLTLDSGKLVWLPIPDACQANWSPDGRSIVVTQATQGYTAVSIADTLGSVQRVLVRASGLGSGGRPVLGGSFSPDGSRVAYGDGTAIWTIGVDGKTKRRVIAHGEQPAWSAR